MSSGSTALTIFNLFLPVALTRLVALRDITHAMKVNKEKRRKKKEIKRPSSGGAPYKPIHFLREINFTEDGKRKEKKKKREIKSHQELFDS